MRSLKFVILILFLLSTSAVSQQRGQQLRYGRGDQGPLNAIKRPVAIYSGTTIIGWLALDDSTLLHLENEVWLTADSASGGKGTLLRVNAEDFAEMRFPFLISADEDTFRIDLNTSLTPISLKMNNSAVFSVDSTGIIDNTIANIIAGGETGVNTQISHTTNALTGELVGVRGNARVNINSAAGTAMGGKFQAGNSSSGFDMSTVTGVYVDVVNKDPLAGGVTWTNARGYEVSMDLNQGTAGNVNTITNSQMFYGVYNLPTVGTYSTVTNGYGVFLRNEAVGGTGQMLDAGFYLDDLNHSGGVYGWDYGMDLSGIGANSGNFGTADIRFSNGALINNNTVDSLTITESVVFIDGTLSLGTIDADSINVDHIVLNVNMVPYDSSGATLGSPSLPFDSIFVDTLYVHAIIDRSDLFIGSIGNNLLLQMDTLVFNQTTGTIKAMSDLSILSDYITLVDVTPMIRFKDQNATAGDVNASIQADATDVVDGSEDIDIVFMQQVAGTPTNWLVADADGVVTIGTAAQGTTIPGVLTIANDTYIRSDNNAGDGFINMFKVNTSDELIPGVDLVMGKIALTPGANIQFVDMDTVGEALGELSYQFTIGDGALIEAYSAYDGAGAFDSTRIDVLTVLHATGDIRGDANVSGATYGSDGSVSNAELLYLDATSSIQTQINSKPDSGAVAYLAQNESITGRWDYDDAVTLDDSLLFNNTASVIKTDSVLTFYAGAATPGNSFVEFVRSDNSGAFIIGRTTATAPSTVAITDGGADNEPGTLQLYDDGGSAGHFWVSTNNELYGHTSAPADDDTDGFPIMDLDNGAIGESGVSFGGLTITAAGNTFNLTQGTGSLDVAAGVAVDIDVNITANTEALTFDQSVSTGDGVTFSTVSATTTFSGGGDITTSDGAVAAAVETVGTLAAAATTFAVDANVCIITGDAEGNTVATITGGVDGQLLTLIFVDALVTISNDDGHGANTVDLDGANNFVSADDSVLQLVFAGGSWYKVSASVN